VQWIQEISKAHWESVAPQKIRENMIWVVRRHDIRYKSAAVLNDRLILTTFIAKSEGFISSRVVQIRNKNDGTLILKSQTDWCPLHKESGKPITISQEIHTLFKTPTP